MLTVSYRPREGSMISASYEYRNMSASRGEQFVPMGMPIICWKTFPAKTSKMLSNSTVNFGCFVAVWEYQNFSCLKSIRIVILWVINTFLFGFTMLKIICESTYQSFNHILFDLWSLMRVHYLDAHMVHIVNSLNMILKRRTRIHTYKKSLLIFQLLGEYHCQRTKVPRGHM